MDEGLVLLQGTLACLLTGGGESVHALHSHMSALRFCMKPSFDCPDDDLSDGAFIRASKCIGGLDTMEEFVSCGV
jgi:hypothetical protein